MLYEKEIITDTNDFFVLYYYYTSGRRRIIVEASSLQSLSMHLLTHAQGKNAHPKISDLSL